jgi:transposase
MNRRKDKTDIERIRIAAVHRVLRGESPEKVIAEYGFARSCIYQWLTKYREGGDDALLSRQSPGRPTRLSEDQYSRLFQALLRPPRGLGAWTLSELLHLANYRIGVETSKVTAWRILKSIGIVPVVMRSPQKMIWWQAHRGKVPTQTYFFDERDVSRTSLFSNAMKRAVFLAAATPRNRVLFQLYSDPPSKQTFETFLNKLMAQTNTPSTLVLSSDSPRYSQAIDFALGLSQDKYANLPPETRCHEQIVGEERDELASRKRYQQPLIVYRLT